jgi:ubiquinone/menaquinone biosynthesis C-methylase UbiE
VTEQAERYDRIATGYAKWWAPVLAPQATALLDRLDGAVAGGARRLIDIGTGTATLAIAAIERWPSVEVVGIDASRGMTSAAAAEADQLLTREDRHRFEVKVAFADKLPFADGSFDAAMSSFVFQLVPNRARAIREAHRVLRPGGTLAYVSWLAEDRAFRPDIEFDDVLDEIGVGARLPDDRPGDIPDVNGAVAQLRRAGFRDVDAARDELKHQFDVEGYVRFMTEFDEEDLVRSLEPALRERLVDRLKARLDARPATDLVLRLPVVAVSGTRG